jgi:hypothetical protein
MLNDIEQAETQLRVVVPIEEEEDEEEWSINFIDVGFFCHIYRVF